MQQCGFAHRHLEIYWVNGIQEWIRINVIQMCFTFIKNNNGIMHCRKDNLKKISFDFAGEEYFKKVRAQTRQKKITYLKLRENGSGIIMKLLTCHFRSYSLIHSLSWNKAVVWAGMANRYYNIFYFTLTSTEEGFWMRRWNLRSLSRVEFE